MSKRVLFALCGVIIAIALAVFVFRGAIDRGTRILFGVAGAEEGFSYLSSGDLERLPVNLGKSEKILPTGNVRQFDLVAKDGRWELTKSVMAEANMYNGTVPGPTIRVTEGDTVRVTVKNELDQETSIHWHGLHIRNDMDGVPPFTQRGVKPGESFTYEFVASHAGTFIYHPHQNSIEQIDKGLYGALIIDPQTQQRTKFDKEFLMVLGAWQVMDGEENGETSPMSGMAMNYNYFTINGKAFPDTEPWVVKQGDVVRVRIINISNLAHPMHLHGKDFKVVAKDGEALRSESQQVMNTLSIDAGETYDIVFLANNPGRWLFHCHELHHTTNADVEPGGLIQVIEYEGYVPAGPARESNEGQASPPPAPTMPADMPGMRH